jgi:hypothetical protein
MAVAAQAAVVAAVVRFPRSWNVAFHPQARRGPDGLAYRPGWRGSGMQPMVATELARYTGKITGVPLTGGQVLAKVPASGNLTLSVGPQGLGTVWYPIQVTLTTGAGQASALGDSSTANAYLGPAVSQNTAVGSVFGGNGVIALAIPDMTPGQTLIATWTGANPGDTAAINIIGTMDALSTS